MTLNLSSFKSEHSVRNRVARAVWGSTWSMLGSRSPRIAHGWRRALLRAFGAEIGDGVRIYPSAKIWAPWNLRMGDFSVLGDGAECYNVASVKIGANVVVSQYAYLCTASHDYTNPLFPLVTEPIIIADGAWVGAGAWLLPGNHVGAGAVVGARACVTHPVAAGSVVVGNPAKEIDR